MKPYLGSPAQRFSLPFVFTLAETLENAEARLFGVGGGERFELGGRAEPGDDFANRLFARGTMRKRLGGQWPVQSEFATANLAVTFAQFVFVERHGGI